MTTLTDPAPGPAAEVVGANDFVRDGDSVRLRIAECRSCASRWFPALAICATCASRDVHEVLSGTSGVIYASTVVRVAPSGFTAPYVLSYVDLDGIRFLAHTDADTALEPVRVELTYGQIGQVGDTVLESYRVRPVPADPTEGGSR